MNLKEGLLGDAKLQQNLQRPQDGEQHALGGSLTSLDRTNDSAEPEDPE